jgi:hypothetical protein
MQNKKKITIATSPLSQRPVKLSTKDKGKTHARTGRL